MPSLVDVMAEICRQQHGQYLLGGYYLTRAQFAAVAHLLTPDRTLTGCRGEFRGIPVHLLGEDPGPGAWPYETLRGVGFTYGLLDDRHPLLISFEFLDVEDVFNKKGRPTTGLAARIIAGG